MFSYGEVAGPPERSCYAWRLLAVPTPVLLVADPGTKRRRARQADEQAERLVTRLLSTDAAYAAKVARARRCQARLRGQLNARSWRLYLQLEEAEVGRWTHALERVAGWALKSKKRAARR